MNQGFVFNIQICRWKIRNGVDIKPDFTFELKDSHESGFCLQHLNLQMEKSDRHQIRFFFILDFLCAYLRVHTINGVILDWFLVHVVLPTHLESSKIYSIICGVIIMVPGLHNETSKRTLIGKKILNYQIYINRQRRIDIDSIIYILKRANSSCFLQTSKVIIV